MITLYPLSQVARELGISRERLHQLIQQGRVQGVYRTASGEWYLPLPPQIEKRRVGRPPCNSTTALRRARERRGWSLAEAAAASGIAVSTLSRLERLPHAPKRLQAATRRKLQAAFPEVFEEGAPLSN